MKSGPASILILHKLYLDYLTMSNTCLISTAPSCTTPLSVQPTPVPIGTFESNIHEPDPGAILVVMGLEMGSEPYW